ncbi:response regulator, partial [Escherichia coli]|uniref:response regulator n=1 Tax=Escherichia coli TaxID=562 RepID=UPI001FCED388
MKILLIEDNQRTQEWVTQGLSEAGYVIDAVSDGRDGLYLALKDDYALIILDIMLPGMDGWQILQTLRTAKQTPVICLTARDSVDDRVRGLDSGWICPYISRHLLSLNPLLACCRRYSRG